MIQNIDISGTLVTVPENISDRTSPLKTERVIPVRLEDEPVSISVDKPWRPYSETRGLWEFVCNPIRSIAGLLNIARYNTDVRYAPLKERR